MLRVGVAVLGDAHALEIGVVASLLAPRSSPIASPLARNSEMRPFSGFGQPSTSAQ